MTDWSQFVAYDCHYCNEGCINRKNATWTQVRECKGCHQAVVLDLREDLAIEDYAIWKMALYWATGRQFWTARTI